MFMRCICIRRIQTITLCYSLSICHIEAGFTPLKSVSWVSSRSKLSPRVRDRIDIVAVRSIRNSVLDTVATAATTIPTHIAHRSSHSQTHMPFTSAEYVSLIFFIEFLLLFRLLCSATHFSPSSPLPPPPVVARCVAARCHLALPSTSVHSFTITCNSHYIEMFLYLLADRHIHFEYVVRALRTGSRARMCVIKVSRMYAVKTTDE